MRPFVTLFCLLLIACVPAAAPATTGGQAGAGTPVQAPHTLNAEQCQAAGGTMRPVCLMGTVQCVVTYSDAGRPCRDGDDCQGNCRADSLEAQQRSVTGRCQATSDPCGCFANVEDGRVEAALCVD